MLDHVRPEGSFAAIVEPFREVYGRGVSTNADIGTMLDHILSKRRSSQMPSTRSMSTNDASCALDGGGTRSRSGINVFCPDGLGPTAMMPTR